MDKFTIYMHINLINNKVYIGQTVQRPEKRWKSGSGYRKQSSFYKDIMEYGWSSFQHIILEDNISGQEEANEKERYYIELYNARDPEKGYNILPGGSSVAGENNPMFGKKHSEKTKQKIKEKALLWSDETKEKMSLAAKKRVQKLGPPFLGKHFSEQAKEKLRQVDRSYMQTEEYKEKMRKAVSGAKNSQAIRVKATKVSTGETLHFDCKKDVCEFLNLSPRYTKGLNNAIKNKTEYYGYYWEEENNE